MLSIPYALDALNFLSADVRNLFGPFINVFLVTSQHWTQTDVGLVSTGSGLARHRAPDPDRGRDRRDPRQARRHRRDHGGDDRSPPSSFSPLRPSGRWRSPTSILSLAGDAFAPAVAALTLGLVTKDALARRLGRNSAFDHGGNIAIALVAGGVGYLFSQRVVFLLVPVFAALTSAAVLMIPAKAINHDRARDLGKDGEATARRPDMASSSARAR